MHALDTSARHIWLEMSNLPFVGTGNTSNTLEGRGIQVDEAAIRRPVRLVLLSRPSSRRRVALAK